MLLLEASPCLQPVTGGPLSGQAGVPIPCSLKPPPLHLEAFPSARGSGQKASALLMFSSPRTWRQALHGDLGLTDSSPCRPGAPLHAGPGRWHWLLASAVETLLSASQQSVSSRSFSLCPSTQVTGSLQETLGTRTSSWQDTPCSPQDLQSCQPCSRETDRTLSDSAHLTSVCC